MTLAQEEDAPAVPPGPKLRAFYVFAFCLGINEITSKWERHAMHVQQKRAQKRCFAQQQMIR